MRFLLPLLLLLGACSQQTQPVQSVQLETVGLAPTYITDSVPHDSDDPAIWVHSSDPAQSLVVGTDKSAPDGGLYVFDLQGNMIDSVPDLNRPNNVDIAYGIKAGDQTYDIAVCSERLNGQLRAFRLPDMEPVDGGGMPIFEGEENRAVMGIALYERPDGAVFAIVSRKTEKGPSDSSALWQYQLVGQEEGTLTAQFVRRFGFFSGKKEIEAIAVDNTQGYVFYSDEQAGVRQYYADPDRNDDTELAHFATEGFVDDHEGIAIYPTGDSTGYITVSDQGGQEFHVFSRKGTHHELLGVVKVEATFSDGSEIVRDSLNADFPQGLFVAMSDDRTFHYYDWRKFLAAFRK